MERGLVNKGEIRDGESGDEGLKKQREFEVKEEIACACEGCCQQVCLFVFIKEPHCTSPPCLTINWPMGHEIWAHLHNIDSGSSILSRHPLPSSYPACIAAAVMYFQYKSHFETSLVDPLCPLLSPSLFLFFISVSLSLFFPLFPHSLFFFQVPTQSLPHLFYNFPSLSLTLSFTLLKRKALLPF